MGNEEGNTEFRKHTKYAKMYYKIQYRKWHTEENGAGRQITEWRDERRQ